MYKYNLFGWYIGEAPDGSKRSTDIAPPNLSIETTPGLPRSNWTGNAWVELAYVHNDEDVHLADVAEKKADAGKLYQSVTMRQARLALLDADLLASVKTFIATQSEEMQIYWETSQEIHRSHPLVEAVRDGLSMSDNDIDDLFIVAAQKV